MTRTYVDLHPVYRLTELSANKIRREYRRAVKRLKEVRASDTETNFNTVHCAWASGGERALLESYLEHAERVAVKKFLAG